MTEKKKKVVQPEQIHLHSVKIVKGQLSAGEENIPGESDITFQTNYELEIFTNVDSFVVRLLFTVCVDGIDANEKKVGSAEYTIEFYFTVDELSEFITMDGETVVISNHLAATLVMIVYSTCRGIILMRVQGTILERFIMPVLNPVTLLGSLIESANQKDAIE